MELVNSLLLKSNQKHYQRVLNCLGEFNQLWEKWKTIQTFFSVCIIKIK